MTCQSSAMCFAELGDEEAPLCAEIAATEREGYSLCEHCASAFDTLRELLGGGLVERIQDENPEA